MKKMMSTSVFNNFTSTNSTSNSIKWKTILVENGKLAEDLLSSPKEFLAKYHNGVYTTARTFEGKSILNLALHLDRLRKIETISEKDSTKKVVSSEFDNWILNSLKLGLSSFLNQHNGGNYSIEARITALINQKENIDSNSHAANLCFERKYDLFVIVEEMPPIPSPPIVVEIYRFHRDSPTIKSLEWVSKRKVLEAEKGSKVNEIVMQSEKNNSLYEGLSSNFFVIQNNSIVTAPEHAVLAGTIQQLVIQCCKSNNIPIIRDFPQVNELDQWEACFLTSTSRLLLPIDCIRVHESKKERNFDNQSSNLLKQLQDLLFQLLKQNSTRII